MVKKRIVGFGIAAIAAIGIGTAIAIQSSRAEPRYTAYQVKVKYCPPTELKNYVGDTHDDGCATNFYAFEVWAADEEIPKVKLYRTQHSDISWMPNSAYSPAVYSKGCTMSYFPPAEAGYYLMDFYIHMQPQAAQDREIIEDNLVVEVEEELTVSESEMLELTQFMAQEQLNQPQIIISGVDDDLPEKKCAKIINYQLSMNN